MLNQTLPEERRRPGVTFVIKRDATGEALYAAQEFEPGEVVLDFEDAVRRSRRDIYTVEHPAGGHLFHPLLAVTAHSCDPNCRISVIHRKLMAMRRIFSGEPITFDYATTERELAHPFKCLCGSQGCRGSIS